MGDLFKEKSEDWDSRERVQKISSAVGTAIVQYIAFDPQMEVMDFGAGTGLICSQIAPLVNRVTAVDISASMLEKLAAKPELEGKVETACQDIMLQPLNKKFDVIISAMAMHHIADITALIRSFAAHLKPGGRIALADLDQEDGSFHSEGTQGVFHFGFERNKLQRVLEEAGFGDIQFETVHTVNKEGRGYPVFLVAATQA